jgi:hypothetical protein
MLFRQQGGTSWEKENSGIRKLRVPFWYIRSTFVPDVGELCWRADHRDPKLSHNKNSRISIRLGDSDWDVQTEESISSQGEVVAATDKPEVGRANAGDDEHGISV